MLKGGSISGSVILLITVAFSPRRGGTGLGRGPLFDRVHTFITLEAGGNS
jgi:hypothetical protein